MCHQFMCSEPATIDIPMSSGRYDDKNGKVEKVDRFSIGALTGFEMALDALRENAIDDRNRRWFQDFQLHDKVTIECIGFTPNPNPTLNDMPEFMVSVER
jgi:hypothetical protein